MEPADPGVAPDDPSDPDSGKPHARAGTPTLTLYGRPGCGLCAETRTHIEAILAARRAAGRPAPALVERDIETDPDLVRRFLVEIPVVELGDHRLTLATSPGRIERLLAEVLDR